MMDIKSLLSNKWFLGAALLVGVYALYVRSRQPAGDTSLAASNAAMAANQGGIGAIVSQLQSNQSHLASLLSGSADTIAQSVSGQSLAFQSAFNKLTDAQAGGFGALLNRLTGISSQAEQLGNEGAANTQSIMDRLRALSAQFSQLGDEGARTYHYVIGSSIVGLCNSITHTAPGGPFAGFCREGLDAAGIPSARQNDFINSATKCVKGPMQQGSPVDVACVGAVAQGYQGG